MARGQVEPKLLSSDIAAFDNFDQRIVKVAGRKLKGSVRNTFFFAYACKEWDEILLLLLDQFGQDLDLETVKKYANQAAAAIETAARTAEEFN